MFLKTECLCSVSYKILSGGGQKSPWTKIKENNSLIKGKIQDSKREKSGIEIFK